MCDGRRTERAGLSLGREQSRVIIRPIHHAVSCSFASSGLQTNTRDMEYREEREGERERENGKEGGWADIHCLYFADKDKPYIVTLTTPTLPVRSDSPSLHPSPLVTLLGSLESALSLEFHTVMVRYEREVTRCRAMKND